MTLAADALTHLATAAASFLIAGAVWDALRQPRTRRDCRCGHDWPAHHHYGSSGRSYCAHCACRRWEPARYPAAGDAPPPRRTPNPRQPGHQPPARRPPMTALPPTAEQTRQRPTGVRIPGDNIATIYVQRTCGCTEIRDYARGRMERQQCYSHQHFAAWARELRETR